jgi:sugar/nucleoside kinase (ribokinase family)
VTADRPIGVFVGAATLDLHYLLAEGRGPNTKGPAERFGLYAGGPAANAAVTFAHLGGHAVLFSEIGSHPLGRAVAADLDRCGVTVTDLAPSSAAVPMVSSVITTAGTGDRMSVSSHYPDAGTAEGMPGPLPDGAAVLLVDGFLQRAGKAAAREARDERIPVVLDAGSWKPGTADLLPFVDVAVCSADFHPPGTLTTAEVLDAVTGYGVRRIAVTRGVEPIPYRDGPHAGEVAVPQVPVVDTLGAGDVFHGAFCFHLAAGAEFRDALAGAALVASHSCRSFGTRAWMEDRPGT